MSELNEIEDNVSRKEEVPAWFIAALIGEVVYLRTKHNKAWEESSNQYAKHFIGWYLWQHVKEELAEGSQSDISSDSEDEVSEYSEASDTEDEAWYGGEEEVQDTSSDIP